MGHISNGLQLVQAREAAFADCGFPRYILVMYVNYELQESEITTSSSSSICCLWSVRVDYKIVKNRCRASIIIMA